MWNKDRQSPEPSTKHFFDRQRNELNLATWAAHQAERSEKYKKSETSGVNLRIAELLPTFRSQLNRR